MGKRRAEFAREMLFDIVDEIVNGANIYISNNFDLKSAVFENKEIIGAANASLEGVVNERKENGREKSAINDKLYEKLMKGEVIIWSDITGSIEEEKYNKTLEEIQEGEHKAIDKIKKKIIKLILDIFGSKHEIIDGYLISKVGKESILLPSSIENLEFYEAEDVYDYIGVEIVDEIKDLFVCVPNNGVKILPDTHNKKYVGTLINSNGKDLIGIKKISSVNSEFVGELLISENKIGE